MSPFGRVGGTMTNIASLPHVTLHFFGTARPSAIRLFVVTVVSMTFASAFGVPVAFASGSDVINDCVAVTMKPHYSAEDYRDALENMPSDIDEYSSCRAQIVAAQQLDAGDLGAAATGGSVSPDSGASAFDGDATDGPAPVAGQAADGAPAGTSPQIDVKAFDDVSPNEFGAFTQPVSGPPVAEAQERPLVPIAIAFAVIVATGARMLVRWGGRRETRATTSS